jgi:hypothetical protein
LRSSHILPSGTSFYTNNIFRNADPQARKGAFERETTYQKRKKLVKEREKILCVKRKKSFKKKLGFTFFLKDM